MMSKDKKELKKTQKVYSFDMILKKLNSTLG